MGRPKEKNAVRLHLSVDAKTYERLSTLAAAYGSSKSRVIDILATKAAARISSTLPPAELVAAPLVEAALSKRVRKPQADAPSGEASVPAKAGQKAKAVRQ